MRGQGRAGAHREPRRPHPRRLPVDGCELAQDAAGVPRTDEGDAVVPDVTITREDQVPMREDLLDLLEIEELEKYFTPEELANHPARRS